MEPLHLDQVRLDYILKLVYTQRWIGLDWIGWDWLGCSSLTMLISYVAGMDVVG